MEKLERLGLSRSVVGLVVPTGYSFNLDGTNIYMTLASLFIAQALGIHLTFTEHMAILIVAMITSKGATGATGSGFITLAATLLGWCPASRLPAWRLILGDRQIHVRGSWAITNHIGNCTAAVVMASWQKELDWAKFREGLKNGPQTTI